MANTSRAVIAGPGYIGAVHTDGLRHTSVDPASPVGSGSEAGRRTETRGEPFHRLQAALAAETVDRLHCTTPNHLHALLARKAILAGKHVIYEPPLAKNAVKSEELLRPVSPDLARVS